MIQLRRNSDAVLFGCFGLRAVRCRLNNDSTSVSQDQRVAVTDDGLGIGAGGVGGQGDAQNTAASWGASAVTAKDEAIVLGGFATKNTIGDDFSGANIQQGGVRLAGANEGNITVNNTAEGVENVTKTFAQTVKELVAARPQTEAAPLADDDEADSTAEDGNGKLLKWVLGVIAFVVVGEIVRRIFFSKAKA